MKILKFILIVLFTGIAQAQITNPYFYSLTKDGRTSYVLGTVHMGVGIQELPRQILDIMEHSPQFAGEMVFTLEDVRMMLEPGYDKLLEDFLDRNPNPGNLDNNQKQMLLSLGVPKEITDHLTLDSEGCLAVIGAPFYFNYSKTSLDFEIMSYVLSEGKPFLGLEDRSVRQNAAKETEESECKIGNLFNLTIDQLLDYRKQLLANFNAYRNGTYPPAKSDPQMAYRNQAWIPKMEELHAAAPTFFFVGVAHLNDEGNILEMLKARGFTVEKVQILY
jgi:hypothetical protein